MRRPQSTLVEFFGPPGVGKSTIAREFNSKLQQRGTTTTNKVHDNSAVDNGIVRILDKFRYIFRSCTTGFWNSPNIFKTVKKSNQPDRSRFWCLYLYSHFLRGVKQTIHRTDGVHILDQGALQFCWAVRYSGHSSISPTTIFDQYPTFDDHVVVFIMADTETLYDRLIDRNHGRSKVEGKPVTKPKLESIQQTMASLFEFTERTETITNIQLTNDCDIETTTETLLDELTSRGVIG